MTSSKLLLFAPELIHAISDELDLNTIQVLRLTCKSLANCLAPQALRSISIHLNQNNFKKEIQKLRALAAGNTAASQGTKVLMIRSLSPTLDPSYRGSVWSYRDDVMVQAPEPKIPAEALQAEEEMKEHLLAALISMKSVKKIFWIPGAKDSEWSQMTMMQALKQLPNLRFVDFTLSYCKVPLKLEETPALYAISLRCLCEEHSEEILESLARMVAGSPQLISIDLELQHPWGQPPPISHSLHQLFKYYPDNAPPLPLRHVGLTSGLVRLDRTMMRHFKSLTSLRLTDVIYPSSFQNTDVDSEELKRVGSSRHKIWETVLDSSIQLEEVEHEEVVPSFLDYLSSYSGLKKLTFTPDGWRSQPDLNLLAGRFFTSSLMNHSQTLEELYIQPLFESDWCFSQHVVSAISTCVNLRKLTMSIISSQLDGDIAEVAGAKQQLKFNAMKLLIDTVAVHLLKLDHLVILSSNLVSLRNARCGNPARSHFHRTTSRMIEVAKMYRAPDSCQRLPSLSISSRGDGNTFVGVRESNRSDARLRYSVLENGPSEL